MDAVKFQLGDTVYRRVDEDERGMVTGILFRPTGTVYFVTFGGGREDSCYDIELTAERTFSNDQSDSVKS